MTSDYYDKQLWLKDAVSGAGLSLPVHSNGDGTVTVPSFISINAGLSLTTVGVSDSADKRFVTDAERALVVQLTQGEITYLAAATPVVPGTASEILLATVDTVNMNSAGITTLYTVPTGYQAMVTRVTLRNCSGNLTTASISFGFGVGANNVITNATHTELTGSSLYSILSAKAGAAWGAAAAVFGVDVNTPQGVAMSLNIDVFGYLVVAGG